MNAEEDCDSSEMSKTSSRCELMENESVPKIYVLFTPPHFQSLGRYMR